MRTFARTSSGEPLWNDTIGSLPSATIAGLTPDGAGLVVAGTRRNGPDPKARPVRCCCLSSTFDL
jgi:hypothetical protein